MPRKPKKTGTSTITNMHTRVQRQPAPEQPATSATETKRQRFERIGEARMNRVLNSIRLLGNLANSNYDWTEEDIVAIQNAIVDQLGKSLHRFNKKRSDKPVFAGFKVEAKD